MLSVPHLYCAPIVAVRRAVLDMILFGLVIVALAAGALRAEEPQRVASLDALYAALAGAKGGETLLLEPGPYGKLFLGPPSGFNVTFAAPVTLMSADRARPAVFSEIDLRGVANLTFDGVVFDYVFKPGHKIHSKPFKVAGSTGITIRNSTFDGDVARGVSADDDGFGYAFALSVGRSTGFRLENNRVFGFYRGVVMGRNTDTLIRNNDITALRMDGMNFVAMTDVRIEDNFIHDFKRSPSKRDHADMIQFWTNGSTIPSTGITIRRNVLMSGAGNSTQSIFMRNDLVDRGLAGREMFYRDVLIEENVIINGHVHGITLGEADGVVIRRNTLLRNPLAAEGEQRTKKVRIPKINLKEDSLRVTIEGNLAAGYPEARDGWIVRDNLEVQDITPTRPGYYHTLFAAALTGDPQVLDSFAYLPGSLADQPQLGSAVLRPGADRSRYAQRRRRRAGVAARA